MNDYIGTPQTLGLLNRNIIENIIRNQGPITKPQIARISNLSLVTVNKTVDVLKEEGRVLNSGLTEPTGGRAAQTYIINKELSYTLNLYYERQQYFCAISNMVGEIIFEKEYTVDVEDITANTCACIDEMIKKCKKHTISGIGLGIPGVISHDIVTNIPDIPKWEGFSLKEMLENKYGYPVFVENDINLAASGLYYNNYKDLSDHMALLYLDQGIGCGLIINRTLFKGFSNFAGEISNISISSMNGQPQTMGFEKEFSYLRRELKEKIDPKAHNILKEKLYSIIGQIIQNIACVLNPEIVAIKCDLLQENDIQSIRKNILLSNQHCPKLVLISEFRKHCLDGVITMCIQKSMPIITISNKESNQ